MPSRCFQDESRCFGSKHVVVFDFVSGSSDSDHPETPEKEVGSSQRKPSTEWILQADSLACFGCIFFVAVFFQTRWKKDRNISEPLRRCLTHCTRSQGLARSYEYRSIFWQVCSDLLTAGALRNWWGDAIWCKHFSICKRLIWITLNHNDNISDNYTITELQWLKIPSMASNHFKWWSWMQQQCFPRYQQTRRENSWRKAMVSTHVNTHSM